MDLDSPDLPSGASAVAPPVPLDRLYKGSWELASPAQVRAKGARIRQWATRVLGRWAAMPLPPIPLQSGEHMLLMRVRHRLSREYRGFKHYLDYPTRFTSADRTVKLKDGAVVRCACGAQDQKDPPHTHSTHNTPAPSPPSFTHTCTAPHATPALTLFSHTHVITRRRGGWIPCGATTLWMGYLGLTWTPLWAPWLRKY